MLPLTGWAEFRKETFLDLISEDGEQWSDLFRIWNCVSMKVTGIPKYIGGKQIMETFGLLATFMNHDGAWITGERTHKSQHPVQAGLSYQEKRDMIILNTHFLPV